LALGGFTTVSANAAQTVLQTYVNCTTADGGTITPAADAGAECQGVAGEGNYVVLTALDQAKDMKLNVSGAGATFSTPGNSFSALATPNTTAYAAGGATSSIRVLTPTVGTITVSVAAATAGSGIYSATTETVVITVVDKAASGIYSAANTTVYLVAGETNTATADATTAPTAVATYAGNDSAVASIVVTYLDGLSTGSGVLGDTLTATITSGPGAILVPRVAGTSGTTSGFLSETRTSQYNGVAQNGAYKASDSVGSVTGAAMVQAGGKFTVLVFANGQTGTTVVTIKNKAGTIIGTKSVVFTSTTAASYTATVVKAFVDGDTTYAGATHGDSRNGAITVVAKDSAGNPIPTAAAPTVTSTSTILSVGCGNNGTDTCTANSKGVLSFFAKSSTAATYGPATVTFTSPDGLVKTTATLTWSSKKASTFTITGPASAGTGDALTFTATAKDAKGYAIPDGLVASTYIVATGTGVPVTSAGIGTPALTGKFANGVATLAATGATVSSASATVTFTLTGTADTADTQYVSTLAGIEIPVTLTLESPTDATASLALDAANAATDAANNAYDEAQNATQAASDALAAVTALAKQVKSLIASVKRLTAAVAKLK